MKGPTLELWRWLNPQHLTLDKKRLTIVYQLHIHTTQERRASHAIQNTEGCTLEQNELEESVDARCFSTASIHLTSWISSGTVSKMTYNEINFTIG